MGHSLSGVLRKEVLWKTPLRRKNGLSEYSLPEGWILNYLSKLFSHLFYLSISRKQAENVLVTLLIRTEKPFSGMELWRIISGYCRRIHSSVPSKQGEVRHDRRIPTSAEFWKVFETTTELQDKRMPRCFAFIRELKSLKMSN